jgi:hypothetical protein
MKLNEKENLERVLKSAVVISWADLMRGAQTGLIHMEYGFAVAGTLDYVQVWSSITRGHWLLACNYWMSASTSHRAGIQFENGYQSERLAHIMDSVMQHQTAFLLPADLGRKGMIQIQTPTQKEAMGASAQVGQALGCIRSALDVGAPA